MNPSSSHVGLQAESLGKDQHEFYIHMRKDGFHFDCTLYSRNDDLSMCNTVYINVYTVTEKISDLLCKISVSVKDRLHVLHVYNLARTCDAEENCLCTNSCEKRCGRHRIYGNAIWNKWYDEVCACKYDAESNLLENGKPVSMYKKCGPVLFGCRNAVLSCTIFNKEHRIRVNAPWVSSISLPPHIVAGYAVTPCAMKVKFFSYRLSKFTWYRNDTDKWTEVGNCRYYTPSEFDVGHVLKLHCVPKNEVEEGPCYEVVSCIVGNTLPIPEKFPFQLRHAFVTKRLGGSEFRVVSYNILAELYTCSVQAREALKYCPTYAIRMDYRVKILMRELKGYNADVICLQEVESKVFVKTLLPELKKLNYHSVFFRKHPKHEEGLACFFNASKFRLIKKALLPLPGNSDLSRGCLFFRIRQVLERNEELEKRFIGKMNSFICVALQCLEDPSKVLIIGNIHLYYHPQGSPIRLLQVAMATTFLEHLVKKLQFSSRSKTKPAVLLCGDFNSRTCSGVYQFITTGFLPHGHPDWSSDEVTVRNNLTLRHDWRLESAYKNAVYTTYVPEFADCIDYIFYQSDLLEVLQVVPLPEEDILKEHGAIPSIVFPSDHLALVADFSWKHSITEKSNSAIDKN